MLTEKELGEALKNELRKGYNVYRIANWAFDLNISLRGDTSLEISKVLNYLEIMEVGPEFMLTEDELLLISEMLINGEADPIKRIFDMDSKE